MWTDGMSCPDWSRVPRGEEPSEAHVLLNLMTLPSFLLVTYTFNNL